jgi:hypothetical protein
MWLVALPFVPPHVFRARLPAFLVQRAARMARLDGMCCLTHTLVFLAYGTPDVKARLHTPMRWSVGMDS